MERCGHPPLMNVILRRGERNTAACLPSLVPLHPFLPPTRSPPALDSIPPALFTPLPSSLLYQLPPRQPTNLSFVSLLRQLRLSQVDTQLQNIQFERKVKTKWIFQREYSRYQKPTLSLLDDCTQIHDIGKHTECNEKVLTFLHITLSYIVQSKCLRIYSCSRVSLIIYIRTIRTWVARNINRIALVCYSGIISMLLIIVSLISLFFLCSLLHN